MSATATIDKAVRKCQGNTDASEVLSLDLSSCQSQNAEDLFKAIKGFPNVKTLNLKNVGLKTLVGFPVLPKLEELDISENELCDDLSGLITCTKLVKLTMNSCGVKSLETLAPLAKLSNLQSLSLKMSPVENLDNFNKKCFALLPNVLSIGECDRSVHDSPHDDHDNGGGLAAENGDNEEEDEDDDADEEEESDEEKDESDAEKDESDEEIGIEALQKSDDLDDEDEEDYNPDEAELDECDDDFEDDEDENDVDEEDTGANLSGAGVTGPRRPTSKRRHETDSTDDLDDEVAASKVQATEGVEENVTNGTTAK